jgi:antitoxin (DNA-binding transcriptional repressor) of toxin-antitoxin stability system
MNITLNQLPPDFQQLIKEIRHSNQTLTITEADQPLAIISPVTKQKRAPFGCLKNTIQIHDDIITPAVLESEWEILQ